MAACQHQTRAPAHQHLLGLVRGPTNDWAWWFHELTHTVQSFGGGGPATFSAEDIKDVDSLAARLIGAFGRGVPVFVATAFGSGTTGNLHLYDQFGCKALRRNW